MIIEGVKKKLFKRIEYKGKTYKRTDVPVIGGIAESIREGGFTMKGRYYLIDDYIYGDGKSTSIIAVDGNPCGVHKHFANNDFYYYE